MRKTLERATRRQFGIFLGLGALIILLFILVSWTGHGAPEFMRVAPVTIKGASSSPAVVTAPPVKRAPVKAVRKPVKVAPPIVAIVATSTPTTTPVMVPAEASSTTMIPLEVATSTATTSTYTPSASVLNGGGLPSPYFASDAQPPVLAIAGCSASTSTRCLITTTSAALSWGFITAAARYGIWVNGTETTRTSEISISITLGDQATSTLKVVAYDGRNTTLESAPRDVRVEVPVTLSSVHDDFNTYNSAGWHTFGGSVKDFETDDSPGTNCFSGDCIVGSANNTFSSQVPRIYLEQAPALSAGAFSVYARGRNGSLANPTPTISLCQESSNCADGSRIDFSGTVSMDDTWHQYYFAWRQGSTHIESCIMQGDTNAAHCSWADTGIALGTKYDGVALWSTNGYRADFGGNLWFDELVAR